MHVLFVHQNYPAQFGHLARWLVREHGYRCTFVSERPAGDDSGVRRIQYKLRGGATAQTHYCSRSFENYTWHTHAVYEALQAERGLDPDLIVGHSGFGSTLYLRELFPVPVLNYFEFFYRPHASDMDFRPEFPSQELDVLRAYSRNAMLLLDLYYCQAGYSPTEWQRSLFPAEYQPKLSTLFDGIDPSVWYRREPLAGGARRIAGREIPPGTRLVTYVSRGFESMRGFDIFMQVAGRIAAARPDVLFVCVGSDRVCYGGDLKHIQAKSFREHVLAQGQYDLDRFWFTGLVPPEGLAEILSASDLHIYLTVPFVLSWSLMNALACGATILASDTAPVAEMIRDGENGLLAGFADVERLTERALAVLDRPEEFRHLGEAGQRLIAERYSLPVILPRMRTLYERVAAGQPVGG